MVGLGESQANDRASSDAGASSLSQGVCVSIDWPNRLAMVNVGGAGGAAGLAMPMVNAAPFPGQAVWVGFLGGQPICLGMVPNAATGTTVGDATSGRVTVAADDGREYIVPYMGEPPIASSRVMLHWAANGVVLGVSSADETGTTPDVPVTPGGGSGARSFFATDSATWRSGGWSDNTFSVSDTRSGFYWYGTQVRDSVPAGATVTGFGIQVAANQAPSSNVTLTLHADGGRAGAPPSALDTFVVSQGSGYKQLPLAWGTAMKSGTAFGIGSVQASASGWMEWQPASTSGALSISWA